MNFERSLLFLRQDLLENWWRLGRIILLIIAAYMLISAHFGALFRSEITQPDISGISWILLLFATSRAFVELGEKARSEDFLLLPASLAEKFIVRMLIVTVILPLLVWLSYFIMSVLVAASVWLLHGLPFRMDFRSNLAFTGQRRLFLAQSVFFLGAVWFRKHHLLRTALAVALVAMVLALLLGAASSLLLDGRFRAVILLAKRNSQLWLFVRWLSILLILSCWWLAWLRFCEAQSNDGV